MSKRNLAEVIGAAREQAEMVHGPAEVPSLDDEPVAVETPTDQAPLHRPRGVSIRKVYGLEIPARDGGEDAIVHTSVRLPSWLVRAMKLRCMEYEVTQNEFIRLATERLLADLAKQVGSGE